MQIKHKKNAKQPQISTTNAKSLVNKKQNQVDWTFITNQIIFSSYEIYQCLLLSNHDPFHIMCPFFISEELPFFYKPGNSLGECLLFMSFVPDFLFVSITKPNIAGDKLSVIFLVFVSAFCFSLPGRSMGFFWVDMILNMEFTFSPAWSEHSTLVVSPARVSHSFILLHIIMC